MPSVAQVSMPSARTSRIIAATASTSLLLRRAPGGAHAEARGAGVLRGLRARAHFIERHQLLALEPGLVANALRAVRAVFGAGAGLDREQRAHLHGVRRVVRAVDFLGAEHQVGERQREQRFDLGDRSSRGAIASVMPIPLSIDLHQFSGWPQRGRRRNSRACSGPAESIVNRLSAACG